MSARSNLPGYGRLQSLRNTAIRTGIYTGVCLSMVFVAWLLIANHAPFLERFALERNIAAAGVLAFLASVPVLRFFRMPGYLLASSMIAWIIFCVIHRALCMIYRTLDSRLSTLHLFMIGAVVYMILTTLSWLAAIIRRARDADVPHQDHRAS